MDPESSPRRRWHGIEIDPESGLSVVVAGSRTFPFAENPVECVETLGQALAESGWPVGELISGGADGVDTAAEALAQTGDIPLTVMEADWQTHGKSAGPRRNSRMVEAGDVLLALWNGESPGTRDTISKARHAYGDSRVRLVPIGGRDVSLAAVDPQAP